MNLKNLNNLELHQQLNSLAANERKITHQVLLHLIEVDRRKLYLEMAYPNLYEYLVLAIGYSAASAQRRIDAARLMVQVPEIGMKIELGSLNLSQVSQVQKAARQAKKLSSKPVSVQQKKSLLKQMENKSFKETELLIAQNFSLPIIKEEKQQIQKDESMRLEITLSKEEMELIKKAQSLLSHSLEKQNLSLGSIKDLLVYCSKKVIQHKTQTRTEKNIEIKTIQNKNPHDLSPQNRKSAEIKTASLIPTTSSLQTLRKKIILRDKVCQYKSPLTGKACNSNHFLEVDHIHPRWAGGQNEATNLRVLCASHNKYRYQTGR